MSGTTQRYITITGAREHNLKNISVRLPKDSLVVITGPSGSGKSSLALDILYTEGKRRYMESLSSYARQFLGVPKKPAFDNIDGLCPAIAIEQKTVGNNPRSTVGTITEIYDYLRILFARIGKVHCPSCKQVVQRESPENVTAMLLESFSDKHVLVAAPLVHERKGEFVHELEGLFEKGFYRFVIDGKRYKFRTKREIAALKLEKTYKHTIDILIDSIEVLIDEKSRLQEGIEKAFLLANGRCTIIAGEQSYTYSSERMCVVCAESIPELEPRFFSFNSPIGACKQCQGLGVITEWPWQEGDKDFWKSKYPDHFGKYATERTCTECLGQRLNRYAVAVTVGGSSIYELSQRAIADLAAFLDALRLPDQQAQIVKELLKEIKARLSFLSGVGLAYLSLGRHARTLSGGEGQRIRLATQIGSALSGVLYVLDEPSIGLHQRDNDRLIATLKSLRDHGNTVVVVEHDIDTIEQADYVVDMGPAAGVRGGTVTAVGSPQELMKNKHSLTGAYLSKKRDIAVPKKRRAITQWLTISHARKNNLKDISASFPLGVLCGVAGVSGSGKSTLVMQELVPAIERELRAKRGVAGISDVAGVGHLDAMVVIDQSPIGRTPRSNPATYLGVFDEIRALFAQLPESNARGYKPGRFSFNVKDGRCFECNGDGSITVSMHFLPEVVVRCKACDGKRYNKHTLEITYKGKHIAQVLDLTAYEALSFFEHHKRIAKRLRLLCEVGLDYVTLGQPSTTLSGGEAQRIKLVDELAKRGKNTLYILDEPTTGLHNSDIEKLLQVLNTLVNKGNSMVIIEHNLDVLKTMDYIIEMGPEGGDAGGQVVASGRPEEVAAARGSYTGAYLKRFLGVADRR